MSHSSSRREFFELSTMPLIGLTIESVRTSPETDLRATPGGITKPPFVSVNDFGAVADGITDDTIAVAKAYESLKATGGTLFFPRGRYRLALELTSRNVHIVGEGRGASILIPVVPNGSVIRALYREGSWDAVNISQLTLLGTGKNEGNGFIAGADAYQRHDEYTGVTFFQNVSFANFDKCIARPFGSIGLWIDGCQFGSAKYHVWARSSSKGPSRDPMHSGCVVVSRCHMDQFTKAMLFLDSVGTDGGQIVFENNIFENGPGFVVYIRNFHSSGGVPGIVFRSNWNENTATASNVTVEGKKHEKAKFLYAENATSAVRFDDTPLGTCELRASGLQTDNCSLQNLTSLAADAASTVLHERVRLFSGTSVGQVRSIAHPPNSDGLRTPWFRMVLPRRMPSSSIGTQVLLAGADRTFALMNDPPTYSTTRLGSGGLEGGPVQRLVIRRSNNLPLSVMADLNGSGWLVTCHLYRLSSGPNVQLQVNGTKGLSGVGDLSSAEWEMLVNISKFDALGSERVTAYHEAKGNSILMVAGITMHSFRSLQDATDFVNTLHQA